mmetsp:Transcript_20393/g.23111  ORF Transcript_20393/g.23111 Transcript_20393/m.23111 type:complete len:172 (-) Transcript_20393:322-837(-)
MGSMIARPSTVDLVMVGIDRVGKTTLFDRLVDGHSAMAVLGFSGTMKFRGREFKVWSYGGRDKSWPPIELFCESSRVVVFVIDSSDLQSVENSRQHIRLYCQRFSKPEKIIILANKQDHPEAISPYQVYQMLEISQEMKNNKLCVKGCSGLTGEGVEEMLNWIVGPEDQTI